MQRLEVSSAVRHIYIYVIRQLKVNLGARWGWVVNATSRLLHSRERDPVAIVQEAGWATEQVFLFNLQHSGSYVYHAV